MPLCKVNEQFFPRFDRHLSRCRCPHYGHADQWRFGRGARMFLRTNYGLRKVDRRGS